MTEHEAWKVLFPTFARFLDFALRTHLPYILALSAVVLSFGTLAPSGVDARLVVGAVALSVIYGWVFFYKACTLRNEIMQDVEFRTRYVGMTDAARRRYFRRRGFDVDLSGFSI